MDYLASQKLAHGIPKEEKVNWNRLLQWSDCLNHLVGVKATGQGKEICGLCKCAKDAEGDKSLFVRTENNLTVQPTLFCLLTDS